MLFTGGEQAAEGLVLAPVTHAMEMNMYWHNATKTLQAGLLGAGTPPHGLSSNRMALITSDCDAMRIREHPNGPNHLGTCALQGSIREIPANPAIDETVILLTLSLRHY